MKRRKLLMIPGPIEFEPAVLRAMSASTTSHTAPAFIECFANALDMMKQVWLCPSGQPFIIAGSGTLAMDMAGSNLIEAGDKALVVSTGYFGERYADLLKRYGADVTVLSASAGNVVQVEEVEKALQENNYKLMTFTHVDTSTAVLTDPVPLARLGEKYDVLTILDGVCSVAGEEIRQEEWGIDVVITASQKAIGVPPGLALMVVSQKALKAWEDRKNPVANYYCDWQNWLPIMKAYAQGMPSYFGTPAVNLIMALEVSLRQILEQGMEQRFAHHKKVGKAFQAAIKALGLEMIPCKPEYAAHTLSAPLFPEWIDGADFMNAMNLSDVIIAGGLLPSLKGKYFRVGHMGSVTTADIVSTVSAVEYALKKARYKFSPGIGLQAALNVLE